MSTARDFRPHYTVADYLQWQGDWELWRGTAVAMTPSPFGRHQYVAANILARLHGQLKAHDCRCRVLPETDWHVSHDTVVRPDLAIVCDGIPEEFLDSPPALIVEVLSASTKAKDRSAKYALYEEHQVPYYVLADPSERTIDAYRWRDGHYEPWTETEFQLPDGCCVSLDAEVFD